MAEKLIPGFENYTIDESGVVRNIYRVLMKSDGTTYTQQRRIKKAHINKVNGRYMITLRLDDGKSLTRFLHRLIALAFVPNPLNKPDINHINGVKTDNRIENLEWCTRKENSQHAERLNLIKRNKGTEHHLYKHGQASTKEYQRIWHRVTSRGYDWNALTQDQREAIGQLPKLSKWDTYGRNH